MARDYYSVLSRATAALDPNSAETRRAVYDRARLAIMDAGLPAAEVSQERAALENAIGRIEMEAQRPDAAPVPDRPIPRPGRGTKTFPRSVAIAASAVALVAAAFVFWPRASVTDRNTAPVRTQQPAIEDSVAPGAPRPASAPGAPARGTTGPSYIFNRQLVYYRSIHPAGTLVIAKSQRFLYLVRPNVSALRYTIAVGRKCSNAVGLLVVSAKDEWAAPVTKDTASARLASAGAGESRFGARSLTLGDTGHRIYGTDGALGTAQDGCLALVNEDIIDLYDRVPIGTRVVIN
jgi:lipoprotein-anchoring transpeptidase ErfK/SrfK